MSFPSAATAFENINAITIEDDHPDERRFVTIGSHPHATRQSSNHHPPGQRYFGLVPPAGHAAGRRKLPVQNQPGFKRICSWPPGDALRSHTPGGARRAGPIQVAIPHTYESDISYRRNRNREQTLLTINHVGLSSNKVKAREIRIFFPWLRRFNQPITITLFKIQVLLFRKSQCRLSWEATE